MNPLRCCPRCGNQNEAPARFCGRCGLRLGEDAATQVIRSARRCNNGWVVLLIMLLVLGAIGVFFSIAASQSHRCPIRHFAPPRIIHEQPADERSEENVLYQHRVSHHRHATGFVFQMSW